VSAGLAGEDSEAPAQSKWTRRRLLTVGLGGAATIVTAGAIGVDLTSRRWFSVRHILNVLDGTCSVPQQALEFSPVGRTVTGTFYSRARNRNVGYTVAYPPGHRAGTPVPLVVMLHGAGGNHAHSVSGMQPAQAVALRIDGKPLPPMAMVTVDGGPHYWNPHPGDDPMGMVIEELIPMCQRRGLGAPPQRIGTMGISMGGYGAILLAEKYPHLISAVAAISPAIWTSYDQARAANPLAYASAADFDANDAVTLAGALRGTPVRVASGDSDPFHPGVVALARVLPPSGTVHFSKGCHDGGFFTPQEPPSLTFLGTHLAI
jgi:S-formylglutathione hydrolase FrmB